MGRHLAGWQKWLIAGFIAGGVGGTVLITALWPPPASADPKDSIPYLVVPLGAFVGLIATAMMPRGAPREAPKFDDEEIQFMTVTGRLLLPNGYERPASATVPAVVSSDGGGITEFLTGPLPPSGTGSIAEDEVELWALAVLRVELGEAHGPVENLDWAERPEIRAATAAERAAALRDRTWEGVY